jgi:hypothetical protein
MDIRLHNPIKRRCAAGLPTPVRRLFSSSFRAHKLSAISGLPPTRLIQ